MRNWRKVTKLKAAIDTMVSIVAFLVGLRLFLKSMFIDFMSYNNRQNIYNAKTQSSHLDSQSENR